MRYLGIVEYDGSNYYGMQRQTKHPSIQKEIEKALKNMTATKILISVAGRTDKGVHAKAQAFHFDTDIELDSKTWVQSLNRRLPDDIRIKKVTKVKDDFHARHSAKSKIYEYRISKKESSVFKSRYEVYIPNLNIGKMKKALKKLEGTHDFKSYSVASQNKPTERTLYEALIKETKTHYIIRFHGDSFLRYMVRRMVGVLINIGKGKFEPEIIDYIFENADYEIKSPTAPAKGLYLVKLFY